MHMIFKGRLSLQGTAPGFSDLSVKVGTSSAHFQRNGASPLLPFPSYCVSPPPVHCLLCGWQGHTYIDSWGLRASGHLVKRQMASFLLLGMFPRCPCFLPMSLWQCLTTPDHTYPPSSLFPSCPCQRDLVMLLWPLPPETIRGLHSQQGPLFILFTISIYCPPSSCWAGQYDPACHTGALYSADPSRGSLFPIFRKFP